MILRVFSVVLMLALAARADRGEAQRAMSEGEEFLKKRDYERALASYTRAVEMEPAWSDTWGNRGVCKYRSTDYTGSLEDLGRALELDPKRKEWRFHRIQTYFYLDRIEEAREDGEALARDFPGDKDAESIYGRALVRCGEVDRGLQLQEKAFERSGRDPLLPLRTDAYIRKADWAALESSAGEAIAKGAPSTVLNYHRVIGLVELGRYDEAAAICDTLERRPQPSIVQYLSRLYLCSTPAAGSHYRPGQVDDGVVGLRESPNPESFSCAARALYLAGRVDEAQSLLATKARRTNAEAMFWLGACYWKLGKYPEARAVLLDARRLNPYLVKHAGRVEGIGDFLAGLDAELAKEGDAPRDRLGHELATHLLTVAEIEALVRRYRFSRAAAEYEKVLGSVKSAARRAEVEARLPEVKGMASALTKLVQALAQGRVKGQVKVGPLELTVTKATEEIFDFTIPKGAGRFPWAFLETAAFVDLALGAGLSPEETFSIGCLAWESGARDIASGLFDEALRKQKALKPSVTRFIARQRGLPPPEGGFVHYRGQWVTAGEKAQLEKGLVSFQGQWVAPADREKLARGLRLVDGKWLPGSDAELLKQGYRKHEGKWMSREDYEALRGQWANAWVEETAHYTVRTNESEAFARELAVLAEAAYAEFAIYFGSEIKLPGKDRMQLWAFRSYEDYRRHCVETRAEDHLNAAGFARSDSNTVVGWNKTKSEKQFLETMVHEAAHLYYFRAFPAGRPPSWHAEGLATYFEGFDWDGKKYRFGGLSEGRVAFARDAMKGGRHIPLKDLLGGDALGLINSDMQKALLFYAECWALNYYLSVTENKAYREAYLGYRAETGKGGTKTLADFFPDMAKLESDWVKFVTGL
jgi:tetratricopeptide (TPR) repeat protein